MIHDRGDKMNVIEHEVVGVSIFVVISFVRCALGIL